MPVFDPDSMAQAWDAANTSDPKPQQSSDPVPDGGYVVRVSDVQFQTSQKGNDMLVWDLVIADGDHAGRHIWKKNMLLSPKNMVWLKRDLKAAGMPVDDMVFGDIEGQLHTLRGKMLKIAIRTKGDFQNIYCNGQAEQQQEPQPDMQNAPYGTHADTDLPF